MISLSTSNDSSKLGEEKASSVLKTTVSVWFAVTVLGQWLFAAYVAAFYGGAAAGGNFERWNEVLSPGYQPGATMSNLAVGLHLLAALMIMLGGPLQFVPWVRARYPKLHRWNGRSYVMLTLLGGLTGLYMVWAHQTHEASVNKWAMSLEAVLIVVAGVLVWRNVIERKMKQHERWAMRLFLVASGVWFFRVILMGWLIINGGPVGFDAETFTGPFLTFLGFAHYLLPLAIYEGYLWAKDHGGHRGQYLAAGVLLGLTLFTVAGIFAATVGMWWPRM